MVARRGRGLLPLLLLSGVVVLVVLGLARGIWLSNLHNGALGLAFTAVGVYLQRERPRQRLGALFLATGVVEAVMFFGRQVGRTPGDAPIDAWWAWLGVWPLAVGVGLTTLCVLLFPDGRLPAPAWRWVVAALTVVLGGSALISAGWPVEYDDAGVRTAHPFRLPGEHLASSVWSALAHPSYAVAQLLWVLAVVVRWRTSGPQIRRQLTFLLGPVAFSALALVVGLALWHTPTPGLLAVALVPVAAGWAIVHGRNLAAYQALTWLSRTQGSATLPSELAQTVAEALEADRAALWMGDEKSLLAVGMWPEAGAALERASLAELAPTHHVRPVLRDGTIVGALAVERRPGAPLSASQERLFDDLAGQAALVIEHASLAELVAQGRRAGRLDHLTPREHDVLELMAQGLSNAAICERLHLSVKTVEPIVGSIFTKLGLHAGSSSNRRVLAVVEYLRATQPPGQISPLP